MYLKIDLTINGKEYEMHSDYPDVTEDNFYDLLSHDWIPERLHKEIARKGCAKFAPITESERELFRDILNTDELPEIDAYFVMCLWEDTETHLCSCLSVDDIYDLQREGLDRFMGWE